MAAPGAACGFEVAEIERRISELWRMEGSRDNAVMRACTLNLVVACDPGDVGISEAVAAFSEQRPCRAIVVIADGASGESSLQAWVSAHCHLGAGRRQVCSEQITLEARGASAELLPETVLQVLCGDLPVHTWWRRTELETDLLFRPLAGLSDRFLADSSALRDPGASLSALASLAADPLFRGHVSDLTWARLEPWRNMIAAAFDPPSTRPLLDHPAAIAVRAGGPRASSGLTAAAAYLACWFASRLSWRPGPGAIRLDHDPRLGRGEVGAVRFTAHAGRVATLVAERGDPTADLVRVFVEMEGSCPLPRVLKLPGRDDRALLCEEADRSGGDPVFESALTSAAGLAA